LRGMAKEEEWAERVAAWRASGKTSDEFSEGQPFTAGGLRHWAYRLGKTRRRATSGPALRTVRLARVVRVARGAVAVARGKAATPYEAALAVEVAGLRVIVPIGFDRRTLEQVLSAIEGLSRHGERR
jgi:hypothetical protein